jgi:hypothetical protein
MNDAALESAEAAIRARLATHPFDPWALAMMSAYTAISPMTDPTPSVPPFSLAEFLLRHRETTRFNATPPPPPRPCTCTTAALMATGCRCGGA